MPPLRALLEPRQGKRRASGRSAQAAAWQRRGADLRPARRRHRRSSDDEICAPSLRRRGGYQVVNSSSKPNLVAPNHCHGFDPDGPGSGRRGGGVTATCR